MLKRIWLPSPNYSSRQGASVRLIVLHSAEGADTIESLGGWFGSSRVGSSSHVGADDKLNTIGEFVRRDRKAWAQAAFNPVAVSIEMCAFASWHTSEWFQHHNMLDNTAKWIAEEAAHFGIPLIKLSPAQARGGGRGICSHSDLGITGGGHVDPGPNFPMDYVITLAHGAQPRPKPKNQEESLLASAVSHDGVLHLFELKDEWIWYTYQPRGKISWNGAKAGVGIAAMHKFASAKGIISISASVAGDGTLHVFGRKADGAIVFTYQKPHSTGWAGGRPGVSLAGLHAFAPAP